MMDTDTDTDTGADLGRWVAAFLDSRADSCTVRTRAMYRSYLSGYVTWATQAAASAPLTPPAIRRYIAQRLQTDRNDTLRNRVRYLRLWCRWLVEQGELVTSPFEGRDRVRMPARKRARRTVYTAAEVVALLHATAPTQWKRGVRRTDRQQWRPDGPLDREAAQGRALVLLLVDSALRAAEAAALTCGVIRHAAAGVAPSGRGPAYKLPVRSKGGHLDIAYISAETRLALLVIIGDRDDADPLFRDWHNRPATGRGLRGLITRLAARAGVALPERPLHAFRHFAARQWVKARVPDLAIRQLMRHEQLTTTQIYTQLDPDELASLHAEASPIAGLLALAGVKAAS